MTASYRDQDLFSAVAAWWQRHRRARHWQQQQRLRRHEQRAAAGSDDLWADFHNTRPAPDLHGPDGQRWPT